jgi:hypothetical protein
VMVVRLFASEKRQGTKSRDVAQVAPPILWGFESGAGAVAAGSGASRRCCEAGSMTGRRIRDGLFGVLRAIGSDEPQNTSAAGRVLFLPDGADRFLEAMF